MGKLRNGLPPKPAELCPADSRGRLSPHSDSSERKLIQQFESGLIPEASFHHADHVHLAFAYLSQYPLLRALDKFSAALKRYATARGKSRLYHEYFGETAAAESHRRARFLAQCRNCLHKCG
jgi:hypothetical protein